MLTSLLSATVLGDHADGWHHGWWPLWLVVWLAIAVTVVWLLSRRWREPRSGGLDRAREILAERYARGELTSEQYRDRLQQLR
jgi:putative membrane protein